MCIYRKYASSNENVTKMKISTTKNRKIVLNVSVN